MINRHALTHSYAFSSLLMVSVSHQTRFFLFLRLLAFFLLLLLFFQINHKICSLQEKKTRILRVLSALRTSIHTHCRSLIFFPFLSLSLSFDYSCFCSSFFLSSSVNDDDYYTQFRACLLYACMCLSARLLVFFLLIYSRKISDTYRYAVLFLLHTCSFNREAILIRMLFTLSNLSSIQFLITKHRS